MHNIYSNRGVFCFRFFFFACLLRVTGAFPVSPFYTSRLPVCSTPRVHRFDQIQKIPVLSGLHPFHHAISISANPPPLLLERPEVSPSPGHQRPVILFPTPAGGGRRAPASGRTAMQPPLPSSALSHVPPLNRASAACGFVDLVDVMDQAATNQRQGILLDKKLNSPLAMNR